MTSRRSSIPISPLLIRTMRSAAPKSTILSALRTRMRAVSFSSGATLSSRSRITQSGVCKPALRKKRGSLPGRYSRVRRKRFFGDRFRSGFTLNRYALWFSGNARRAAASTRAAMTNGTAPRSSIETAACSTFIDDRTSLISARMESPYSASTLLERSIEMPPRSVIVSST